MNNNFTDSAFASLYAWTAKAKYTMGIFFLAYVLLYLFLGLIAVDSAVTLDLPTAIEMLFACFGIGLLQQAIIPMGKLSRPRCALWMVSGSLITLAFSLIFGWFTGFPLWCFILFLLLPTLGMGALILAYYIDLSRETQQLNEGLRRFQSGATKRGEHDDND